MIQRTRNTAPTDLNTLHDDWVIRWTLDNTLSSKIEWSRANKKAGIIEARNNLLMMYDGKCCFCEHKTNSHPIDHFVPHSQDPSRLFDYSNLHLICNACNGHKSSKAVDDVIDPSNENPGDHISFSAENAIGLTDRGFSTIKKIRLNHEAKKALRQGELRKVERIIRRMVTILSESKAANSLLPQMVLSEMKRMISDIREDNFSLSSQYSRMFNSNLGASLDEVESVINSKMAE